MCVIFEFNGVRDNFKHLIFFNRTDTLQELCLQMLNLLAAPLCVFICMIILDSK